MQSKEIVPKPFLAPDVGIYFVQTTTNEVKIMLKDKELGRIFTPGGSGDNKMNCIQICGFSEAFDLWGCGHYRGFKDIQLLYDSKKMKGTTNFSNLMMRKQECCLRCFRYPCQCEVRFKGRIPFLVKRSDEIIDRIIVKKYDKDSDKGLINQ
jgi:hypothetical protein